MKRILVLSSLLCLSFLIHAQEQKLRVAVLDPTTSGIAIDDGTRLAVQELISSTIVNTGRYTIIERSMIDKIIKEQAFQNGDMADNSQATEIGKLAGANKVVLSAVSKVGSRNMLSIKVIDVKTASIDKQKATVVTSEDLLDEVVPLTMELMSRNNESHATATVAAPTKTFDYNSANETIVKQVKEGISSIKATIDQKLSKQIAAGKIQSSVMLSNGGKATLSESGVLILEGKGEITPSDAKLFSSLKKYAKAIEVGEGITKISGLSGPAIGTIFNVKMKYVSLPNSLEEIGDDCFADNSYLEAVNIPLKVKKIGKNAFRNCKKITCITLHDNIESVGDGMLNGCESLKEVNIPSKLKTIPNNFMRGCKAIQSLFIPDNVVSIGESAFYQMKGLNEIRLSNKLEKLPKKVFEDCQSLTKVECPVSVKNVDVSAFEGCTNLIQIVFLCESMTSMGKNCLANCKTLANIVFHSTIPPVCNDEIFDDEYLTRVSLSVPAEAQELYRNGKYWKNFLIITSIKK